MTRITRLIPAVVTLAACLLGTPAAAQLDNLPPTSNTTYSQDEKQQISDFTSARLDLIGAGSTEEREKARRELLSPLRRPGVSVAFRRAFREVSIGQLTTLAASADDTVAINALVVLGAIADDPSRQVLENYTADERVAVRYAATRAMTDTFQSIDLSSPAIDPGRVSEMVRHLTARLQAESDPSVADVVIRSLLTAAAIEREGFEAPASRAMSALAAGTGARLRAADESSRPLALMSTVRVAEAFSQRLAAAGSVPPSVAKAGAGFSGEVLAHMAARAQAGILPPAEGWEADLLTLSERIMVFSALKLGGRVETPNLTAFLTSSDARGFYDKTRQLVLTLSGKPWELPSADMDRISETLAEKQDDGG